MKDFFCMFCLPVRRGYLHAAEEIKIPRVEKIEHKGLSAIGFIVVSFRFVAAPSGVNELLDERTTGYSHYHKVSEAVEDGRDLEPSHLCRPRPRAHKLLRKCFQAALSLRSLDFLGS